jgi:hypothetical protein
LTNTSHGFDEKGIRRVIKATRYVEGIPTHRETADYGTGTSSRRIVVRLEVRDSTDKWKVSEWTQVRRLEDGTYEDQPNGLTHETSSLPLLERNSLETFRADATNGDVVVIHRECLYTDEDEVSACWVFDAPPARFTARITAVSGSFPAWSYTVQRVVSYNSAGTGAARAVTDGVNLTALNGFELVTGTAPYTHATGITITNATTGVVNSGSCLIQAIGVGAVVDVDTIPDSSGGGVTYIFKVPNSAED